MKKADQRPARQARAMPRFVSVRIRPCQNAASACTSKQPPSSSLQIIDKTQPNMPNDVLTMTYYADRDEKYLKEKPYELKFLPPEDFPVTNMKWSRYDNISVTDVRGHEDKNNIERTGFLTHRLVTSLTYEDFSDSQKIEQVYLREVAHCLKHALGADRVLVFDYNVSLRNCGAASDDAHHHFRSGRARLNIHYRPGRQPPSRRQRPLYI